MKSVQVVHAWIDVIESTAEHLMNNNSQRHVGDRYSGLLHASLPRNAEKHRGQKSALLVARDGP